MALGVLMDIAGVLYDRDQALPGAIESVLRLHAEDIPVRYLTNSTRRPKRRIIEKLTSFGITVKTSEVLTPAEAACNWLRREGYAPHLLVHPDLEEDFLDTPTTDRVAVVVGDAGPYFTFDRMNAAFRTLMQGAPFLALAANRVFSDADGELSLDAGAFVRALEYSSGKCALLLGKPSPEFFQAGARSMGCELSDVVMIGDDAESDISGAVSAGIQRCILVKTGKYRDGDEERYPNPPSFVAADAAGAIDVLLKEYG